jgi:hypothetical protein
VVQSQLRQTVQENLSRKYLTQKKVGRVAQAVQCLLSKLKAPSSNSNSTKNKNKGFFQAWVSYSCNPSYSGGRDQYDQGLKPTQGIVHETLSQKNPSHTQKKKSGKRACLASMKLRVQAYNIAFCSSFLGLLEDEVNYYL